MEIAPLIKKAEKTVSLLKEKNLKLATAESCTGGMLSAFITSVSGVSEIFELGVTSYSCRIKNEILGVDSDILETKGAICEETAKQMAENVRKKAKSDIGVSVTGVAGPSPSEGHPVGYIFVGVAGKDETIVRLLNLGPEDRDVLRTNTVSAVFDLIEEYIKGRENDKS